MYAKLENLFFEEPVLLVAGYWVAIFSVLLGSYIYTLLSDINIL